MKGKLLQSQRIDAKKINVVVTKLCFVKIKKAAVQLNGPKNKITE